MFRQDRLLRHVVKERFVVTPKAGCGPMFKALLVAIDAKSFVFADVAVIDQGAERPAPGELHIERTNVAYMQRVFTADKE